MRVFAAGMIVAASLVGGIAAAQQPPATELTRSADKKEKYQQEVEAYLQALAARQEAEKAKAAAHLEAQRKAEAALATYRAEAEAAAQRQRAYEAAQARYQRCLAGDQLACDDIAAGRPLR